MTAINSCPKCGSRTFHQTPKGRKCSKCGYEMVVPLDVIIMQKLVLFGMMNYARIVQAGLDL